MTAPHTLLATVAMSRGQGWRQIAELGTDRGFPVGESLSEVDRPGPHAGSSAEAAIARRLVEVRPQIQGKGSVSDLVVAISAVPDVDVVTAYNPKVVYG